MATTWTNDELDRIGSAEELRIASTLGDGRPSRPRTIWVVRVGGDIYVRSVYGPGSDWYRSTRVRREGHIRAGGVDKNVSFEEVDDASNGQVDAAYSRKYHRYSPDIIEAITSPAASSTPPSLEGRS
ncbi:DUF2255 family protein [Streptomyces acidicola]|uniref:DUF2255 family protein n=1 Tax=Streptomyces acidicola TaxID=2596892 RepID=UPI0034460618